MAMNDEILVMNTQGVEENVQTIKKTVEEMQEQLRKLSKVVDDNIGDPGDNSAPISNVNWAMNLKETWINFNNKNINQVLENIASNAQDIHTAATEVEDYANSANVEIG